MADPLADEELDAIERNAAAVDPANHQDAPYVCEQAQEILALVAEVRRLRRYEVLPRGDAKMRERRELAEAVIRGVERRVWNPTDATKHALADLLRDYLLLARASFGESPTRMPYPLKGGYRGGRLPAVLPPPPTTPGPVSEGTPGEAKP